MSCGRTPLPRGAYDSLLRGESLSVEDQLKLCRIALALKMTQWQAIDPEQGGAFCRTGAAGDAVRFSDDPSWADGWNAAVDFFDRRLDELLSTIDESGLPWPESEQSFRHEMHVVYRKPTP